MRSRALSAASGTCPEKRRLDLGRRAGFSLRLASVLGLRRCQPGWAGGCKRAQKAGRDQARSLVFCIASRQEQAAPEHGAHSSNGPLLLSSRAARQPHSGGTALPFLRGEPSGARLLPLRQARGLCVPGVVCNGPDLPEGPRALGLAAVLSTGTW